MIKFEKPEYKIAEYIESNHFGKFELDPLERGFGTTIGNALRRVMLSSLPGSAITSVWIDGIMHEFQKMEEYFIIKSSSASAAASIIIALYSSAFAFKSSGISHSSISFPSSAAL